MPALRLSLCCLAMLVIGAVAGWLAASVALGKDGGRRFLQAPSKDVLFDELKSLRCFVENADWHFRSDGNGLVEGIALIKVWSTNADMEDDAIRRLVHNSVLASYAKSGHLIGGDERAFSILGHDGSPLGEFVVECQEIVPQANQRKREFTLRILFHRSRGDHGN